MPASALDGVVQITGLKALIASLATMEIIGVHDIRGIKNSVTVERFLGSQTADKQVAILIFSGVIRVITVFAFGILNGRLRHRSVQFVQLLKKRTLKINVFAVDERIISVSPPHMLVVYRVARIRRVDGNNLFLRLIAFSMVKTPLISESETMLPSALRTQRRWRYRVLLPAEFRRDFVVEREILVCDLESGRTLRTGLPCTGAQRLVRGAIHVKLQGKSESG